MELLFGIVSANAEIKPLFHPGILKAGTLNLVDASLQKQLKKEHTKQFRGKRKHQSMDR